MNRSMSTIPNPLLWVIVLTAAALWISSPPSNLIGQDAASKDSDTVAAAETSDAEDKEEDEDEIEEPAYDPESKQALLKDLSPLQFKVTQNEETEPAFRNKYWDNKREGLYRCIVCGQSLFSSETKFKSGTGWPSFYAPIKKDHVGYKADFYLFYPRKEVHCSRCKAHLGHVFDDGPKDKTGKRFCMNSASLKFEPKTDKDKDSDGDKKD